MILFLELLHIQYSLKQNIDFQCKCSLAEKQRYLIEDMTLLSQVRCDCISSKVSRVSLEAIYF